MGATISEVKESLTGMGHGGTLNKVRNPEAMFRRAASTMLLKCKPMETIRIAPLSQTIHDELNDYALPSDFGSPIDLYPQAGRDNLDQARRILGEKFSLTAAIDNKTISIEGSEGSKVLRVNWKWRSPKVLNSMNSYDGNGTWLAVGTASGIETDSIYKYSGSGSVKFDVAASGDGISNIGMSQIDLTNEDEIADIVIAVYLPSVTGLTSITPIWGNDITTKFWTGTAQTTQADGTAFRIGWNIIKASWATATETGTVVPTAIDSCKITFQVSAPIANIRVDNILFSIGQPFDIKYYSKYLFKTAAGVYIKQTTDDTDIVTLDEDGLQIFLLECLNAMAQQVEGTDSAFDVEWVDKELKVLYPAFKGEHQSQTKRATSNYGMMPRFHGRGRGRL